MSPSRPTRLGNRNATTSRPIRSILFILLLIPILCGFLYTLKFHITYFNDGELLLDSAWPEENLPPNKNDRKPNIQVPLISKDQWDERQRETRKDTVSNGDIPVDDNTSSIETKNRVYCGVPFIWKPSELHAYYAIHATWGKRCHILRFFIDPIIGDNEVGYYNMTLASDVIAAKQKANMTLPDDVVILHDMRRPWHSCGKQKMKNQGNCRNIFEKVWRMAVYIADGSGGTCVGDDRLVEVDGLKVGVERAEWFIKADQDTFLFPDNVGRYIETRNWSYNDPHYFGHVLNHRKEDRGVSFVAGGAVFYSRSALLAAADSYSNMPMNRGDNEEDGTCRDSYTGTEEVVTAVCLKEHNITAEHAIDYEGREEISLYELSDILGYNRTVHGEWWFWDSKKRYPCHDDGHCVAHLPLAFHHYKDSQDFLDIENELYGTTLTINHSNRLRNHLETHKYFENVRAAMKRAKDEESQSPMPITDQLSEDKPVPVANIKKQPESSISLNNTVQNRLYCMIPFIWSSKYINSYNAIHKTWGNRCDTLKFFIDPIIGDKETGFIDLLSNSSTLPKDVVIVRDMKRSWNKCISDNDKRCKQSLEGEGNTRNIWEKIWRSWVLVDDMGDSAIAEWFVKIDADSYIFPNNLKRYVTEKKWSPEEQHYFGHILRHRIHDAFPMIAGSAVFFSRATLKSAVSIYRKFDSDSNSDDGEGVMQGWAAACQDAHTDQEETITAYCLKQHAGVDAEAALDDEGQELVSVGEIEYGK